MPQRLDKKDQRILSALSGNARQSLSEIGRKVGLSEEVVNYRLKNLIQEGVVARFRTEIDFSALGYRWYRLYMRVEGADSEKEEEMFNYLVTRKGAYWAAVAEGKYNFILRFVAKDEFGLNEILNDLSVKYSPYLRGRDLTIPIEAQFYPGESGCYETGGARYEIPRAKAPVGIDRTDARLLELIVDNARTPTSKLAGELGITPNAVRYRMRKLEMGGVIRGYQMVSDRTKLGMYHHKIIMHFQKTDEEKIRRFVRHCESLPNLVFLTRSVGAWDMDVDLDFRNIVEFHEAVLEMTSSFRDLIRSYDTISVFRAAYCNPVRGLLR